MLACDCRCPISAAFDINFKLGVRAAPPALEGAERRGAAAARPTAMAPGRLLCPLLLVHGAGARQLDVHCQRDVVIDTAAILNTVNASLKGDVIQIHGTCVVNETVPLLEGRGFVGVDKNSSRIVQADGANLPALAASDAWLKGTVAPGSATRIAHLTLDGNSQANTGTHTIVLRAWLLNVYDLNILNSAEDGIRVTSFCADTRSANQATQSQVNSYFSKLHIEGAGNIGFHVVDQMADLGITDSHLLDSRVMHTGGSAVVLGNAAGWQVRNVHISEAGENGIVGVRCSSSSFTDNLIEDFGHQTVPRSRTKTSLPVIEVWNRGGDRWFHRIWFGLVCYAQPDTSGGSVTIVANNRIYHDRTGKFTPIDGNASTNIIAMIGMPDILGSSPTSVPTGKLHITGNTLGGGNRRWSVGEWYATPDDKRLEIFATGNDVFGVRKLRSVSGQVKAESGLGYAAALDAPGQIRRDPCCPLANPASFAMPYQHGDLHSPSSREGPLYAFMGFERAGDTLMHKVLARRQNQFSPACFWPYLQVPGRRHARRLDAFEHGRPICDIHERGSQTCHQKTCDFSAVSVDAMMDASKTRFCEDNQVGGLAPRPCEYFTLLRDPVDRLYADYASNCRACKEAGRCSNNDPVRPGFGPLTCPDMTIEAYARYFGNVYTRAFAAKAQTLPASAQHASSGSAPSAAAEIADRVLQSMFVMLEMDLALEEPFAGLADWMADSTSASLRSLAVPPGYPFDGRHSEDVPPEVREALKDDIWLYQRAVERRNPGSAARS